MQKEINKIIKHLSLLYYIPSKDVEDAIKSQFLFVKRKIEEAERDKLETFKTIKLLSFGKFIVKKDMFNHMLKAKQKKKDRENGDKDK